MFNFLRFTKSIRLWWWWYYSQKITSLWVLGKCTNIVWKLFEKS